MMLQSYDLKGHHYNHHHHLKAVHNRPLLSAASKVIIHASLLSSWLFNRVALLFNQNILSLSASVTLQVQKL